jgi:hypothetical protein
MALLVPLGVVTVTSAAPAYAEACCWKHVADNTDPFNDGHGTDCWDSSAYVVNPKQYDDNGNLLELWYSPACGTNWAEIVSPGTYTTELWTQRQSDGVTTSIYKFKFKGQAWSNQLNAPYTNARACEEEITGSYPHFVVLGPTCRGQYGNF